MWWIYSGQLRFPVYYRPEKAVCLFLLINNSLKLGRKSMTLRWLRQKCKYFIHPNIEDGSGHPLFFLPWPLTFLFFNKIIQNLIFPFSLWTLGLSNKEWNINTPWNLISVWPPSKAVSPWHTDTMHYSRKPALEYFILRWDRDWVGT